MKWLTTAKRFIFETKESKMVVVELGYTKYILPREKAMVLIEALEHAEIYEQKYWSEDKRAHLGMDEAYTYHVYPNQTVFSMGIVSDSQYQMAKLAGKPPKD